MLMSYPTFMKHLTIIIFCLTLVGCNNTALQTNEVISKSIHVPDTTNNWYAKLYDYPNYVTKTEIAKELKLDNLETDTLNSEVRIWIIGSNYNPQRILSLKKLNNTWTIARITYYLKFKGQHTKVKADSVSIQGNIEKEITLKDFNLLNTEQLWLLPSQSEMKIGSSYGCTDGYALFIEINSKSKYKFSSYMCPDMHVAKDSTFRTVENFVKNLGKLFNGNNLDVE